MAVPSPMLVATAVATLLLLVGPIRRFVVDLTAWLVARVPFPCFVVGAAACVAFVSTSQPSPKLVVAALLLAGLGVAGARRAWRLHRRRCAGTLLVLAFNAVALGLADVAVREYVLPNRSHNDLFVVSDPWLGWKLRPNYSIDRKIVKHDYASHETSNSLGFRGADRPVARKAGVRRVVVIGDSHTEGYTVSDGQTWPELLERELSKTQPTEVIPFGVGGWSTDQEYLAYLHCARDYQPDLVLLQFCSNDPPYNVSDHYWRGLKPRFARYGSQLVLEGVPVPERRPSFTRDTLLAHSAIAILLEISHGELAVGEDVARVQADDGESWNVTRLLLRDFDRTVAGDHAKFAVFDADPDERDAERKLRELCRLESITYLDVDPAFGGDYVGHRVKNDPHWNVAGHAAVAQRLATLVEPLLPGPDERESLVDHER